MDSVHFLNLEYILLKVYNLFTASNVDYSQIPAQTLQLMSYVAWAGLALGCVFVVGSVIIFRRLHATEHAGWHERHEEEEALRHRADIHSPVNPQWEHVLLLASGPTESDWRRAIIEADIMLEQMLEARGYSGATLGDKLKGANPLQFTTLDLAWKAHKVRNDIAHLGERFELNERDTKTAIDQYRRVFEEFDYL